VPPFSLDENYFFDDSKRFIAFANKSLSDTEKKFNIAIDDNTYEITVNKNVVEGILPNAEMETIQCVFDGLLSIVGIEKIKRFRGYASLKKSGIIFDKIYKPDNTVPTEPVGETN
jgi:hypothetical protein